MERLRLHFQAVDHTWVGGRVRFGRVLRLVLVGGLFDLLVETEAQSVLALMPDGQIREDEVAGGLGPVQVDHAGNGSSSQHGRGTPLLGHATVGNLTGLFQSGEQKVVGIHIEGDVVPFGTVAFEYLKLNNGRRIYRAAVGRRLCTLTACSRAHRLLQYGHLVGEGTAIGRHA